MEDKDDEVKIRLKNLTVTYLEEGTEKLYVGFSKDDGELEFFAFSAVDDDDVVRTVKEMGYRNAYFSPLLPILVELDLSSRLGPIVDFANGLQ